jgi:hypothetical protein
MRLDATTAEVVSFLRDRGFTVNFPIEAELTDEHARVALRGGHYAIVTRADDGRLRAAVECNTPPVERLTYHDMLVVYTELERRRETVQTLLADVAGKPGFRNVAREYADNANNISDVLSKIGRILKAERSAQYAAEAQETANAGA